MMGEKEQKKTEFFTVKEVSGRTGLSVSTLRYYDSEGLTPQITRSSGGVRQYTQEDVCWLELICCLKHSGMALEDIRRFMGLCLGGEETAEERREILLEQRKLIGRKIEQLQCSLKLIECKLEHYKEVGLFHFGEP